MTTNVNTNIDDKLFYFFGVKPLEKEIANFDKKVCEFLVTNLGCSKVEAFIAWQLYKINIRLMYSPAVAVREAAAGAGKDGQLDVFGKPQLDVGSGAAEGDNSLLSINR